MKRVNIAIKEETQCKGKDYFCPYKQDAERLSAEGS